MLGEVLRGGAETARLAGAPVLGGHSIDDPEPKYGMAVTGLVHPERVLRNVGARPGDRLLLTKPLGTGIMTTAIKRGIASAGADRRAIEVMAALNRAAGEALAASGAVHALTDVTGFGLLGHAWEMAEGSGVALRSSARAVPILEGVIDLAARDVVPGGSKANLGLGAPASCAARTGSPRAPAGARRRPDERRPARGGRPGPGRRARRHAPRGGLAAVEVGEVRPG